MVKILIRMVIGVLILIIPGDWLATRLARYRAERLRSIRNEDRFDGFGWDADALDQAPSGFERPPGKRRVIDQ